MSHVHPVPTTRIWEGSARLLSASHMSRAPSCLASTSRLMLLPQTTYPTAFPVGPSLSFPLLPSSPPQASTWLGDHLEGLLRINLCAGDTLLLPSAWPHAVATPEAAVAVGGPAVHHRACVGLCVAAWPVLNV